MNSRYDQLGSRINPLGSGVNPLNSGVNSLGSGVNHMSSRMGYEQMSSRVKNDSLQTGLLERESYRSRRNSFKNVNYSKISGFMK